MIFSSIQYLLFLPVVVLLYWRMRGTARLAFVVGASYFFYMSWLPIYGLLLFGMTTLNWALGLGIERTRQSSPIVAKSLLTLALLANLGCLGYYKYVDFAFSTAIAGVNFLARFVQTQNEFLHWDPLGILLPLGISFFVFEFVHYTVDVYRGDKALTSWLEFAAFAAFFPSQIAGPIKRYQDFVEGLRKPIAWSEALLAEGGALIVQGMFKKLAIADPISDIIAKSFMPGAYLSCPDAWLAAFGFMIQIFCDFSGYTDIGRGSALLLGIRLPDNFRLPYLSPDIGEFWRRWHMSLGSWLRDYLYIPLGGSRGGRWNTWMSLLVTMTIAGVWHGAAWHFIAFGTFHGLGLVVNREWRNLLRAVKPLGTVCNTTAGVLLSTLTTAVFVMFGFLLFRAPDMSVVGNIAANWVSSDMSCSMIEPICKSGLLTMSAVYLAWWGITTTWTGIYSSSMRYASWTAAVIMILAAKPSGVTPFLYFQF
jgi:alginate O-acetyltransferase complex protein AlgI